METGLQKSLIVPGFWRGDSIVANKQLFRLLRLRGSPSLKREAQKLERAKRKLDKCSKCGALGQRI